MNKGIVYMLISLMLMTGAMAVVECGPGEVLWPDLGDPKICDPYGDDAYLITKWSPGNDGTVNGITVNQIDANNAGWSSTNGDLIAVLVHAGNGQCVLEHKNPGTSGTATDVNHALSFVAFCGYPDNGNGNGNGNHEVPEFSLITLGLAVVGAGLGLVFLRKK